jgi:hypothetical protein
MEIKAAQSEVRTIFSGGSVGQAISGVLWLVSAALATWVSARSGMIALAGGGIFIFPLTQLTLKVLGRKASLSRANPFNGLAMQVAFIVPLCLPVILALAWYDPNWFYPAFMIVVGVHYLPFITLYGMPQYAVLAAVLVSGGAATRFLLPDQFALSGWLAGVVLILFAIMIWRTAPIKSTTTHQSIKRAAPPSYSLRTKRGDDAR